MSGTSLDLVLVIRYSWIPLQILRISSPILVIGVFPTSSGHGFYDMPECSWLQSEMMIPRSWESLIQATKFVSLFYLAIS